MRLSRGQKTIRNFILCLLLGALVYAALGFPPYTVRGMLERMERQYLLSDLEPLLVERSRLKYSNEFFAWHDTVLIARSGDTYVCGDFDRHLLNVEPGRRGVSQLSRGTLIQGLEGVLYIAGDFEKAVSATVEVTVQRTTQIYNPETEESETTLGEKKTFAYQGEKVNDALLAFRHREADSGGWDDSWFFPSRGLAGAAREWYREYLKGADGDGYSIIHANLPVKLTLYDVEGQVLDTLELSVDNYELYMYR